MPATIHQRGFDSPLEPVCRLQTGGAPGAMPMQTVPAGMPYGAPVMPNPYGAQVPAGYAAPMPGGYPPAPGGYPAPGKTRAALLRRCLSPRLDSSCHIFVPHLLSAHCRAARLLECDMLLCR